METLSSLVVLLILIHREGNAEMRIFPFLNTTSLTMLDKDNRPIRGFFTMPQQPRTGTDFARKLSTIEYVLYTREKPEGVTVKSAAEMKNTTFDNKKCVKFITHGWLSSGIADTCMEIKNGYLKKSDVNVIIFNWHEIAEDVFYLNPMFSVPDVASHYATFINHVIDILEVDPKNIHLVGHSLGAHLSGLVWKDMNGRKPGRVTGLDPAFPGFDHIVMYNDRISQQSAEFVDIIHSCGGLLGLWDAVGHVDFYPNGGTSAQPGCLMVFEACSHGRSWQFFADSLQYPERKFHAVKCSTWNEFNSDKCSHNEQIAMGDETPSTSRGIYYLKTNPERPFAMDENK